MPSPARAVELPTLTDAEAPIYLAAYQAAREKGKPSAKARKAGLAAVRRYRKAHPARQRA